MHAPIHPSIHPSPIPSSSRVAPARRRRSTPSPRRHRLAVATYPPCAHARSRAHLGRARAFRSVSFTNPGRLQIPPTPSLRHHHIIGPPKHPDLCSAPQWGRSIERMTTKPSAAAACAAALLLLLSAASASAAAAAGCDARRLTPCAGPAIFGGAVPAACCAQLRAQQGCLCGYERSPTYGTYIRSPNARRLFAVCRLPVPRCG